MSSQTRLGLGTAKLGVRLGLLNALGHIRQRHPIEITPSSSPEGSLMYTPQSAGSEPSSQPSKPRESGTTSRSSPLSHYSTASLLRERYGIANVFQQEHEND